MSAPLIPDIIVTWGGQGSAPSPGGNLFYSGAPLSDMCTGLSVTTADNFNSVTGKLFGGLSALCATLTTTNSTAASLASTVGALTTTVANLSTTVANLSTTVATLNTTVNNLASTVSGLGNTYATKQNIYDNTAGLTNKYIVSGLTYTSATGLVATFTSGKAYILGQLVTYAGGTTSLTASLDNYVYLKNDASLQVKSVTTGNPPPATDSGSVRLWKFTTSGSGVTANDGTLTIRNMVALFDKTVDVSTLTDAAQFRLLPASPAQYNMAFFNGTNWILSASLKTDGTKAAIGTTIGTEYLSLNGAITLKVASGSTDGTIQYTPGSGGQFQGKIAAGWIDLGITTFAGLSDVNVAGVSDGQFVRYDDGSSKYINSDASLSDLSNVSLTSPATNDVLQYNGSAWVNIRKNTALASVKTGTTTLTAIDEVVYVDTSMAGVTLNLPPTGDPGIDGIKYWIKDIGNATAHAITIAADGGENIQLDTGEAPSINITVTHGYVILQADATNHIWWQFGSLLM